MTKTAEREQGERYAGALKDQLREVATRLHHNESLHLHAMVDDVEDCGYCWLRAGHTLGVVASMIAGIEAEDLARARHAVMELEDQNAGLHRIIRDIVASLYDHSKRPAHTMSNEGLHEQWARFLTDLEAEPYGASLVEANRG